QSGAAVGVPQKHATGKRRAGDLATVGRIGDAIGFVMRPGMGQLFDRAQDGQLLAALGVPEPYRVVPAPAGEPAAVGGIRHAARPRLVPPQAGTAGAAVAVQIRTVLSAWSAPLAIWLPSGEYARQVTSLLCPRSTASSAPVWASHTRTVQSRDPLA